MGSHKVTTSVNSCVLCGITFHKDLPVPLMVHYELPVNAYHAPGASAHALTGSVFHRTFPIMKQGHDCGPLIIHIPVSVINLFLVLIIPTSERKNLFSASTVLMEKTPTACCNMWPYTPMLACSLPFNAPAAFPIDNDVNSVLVGMTAGDWAAGVAVFVIQAVVETLTMFPSPDDSFSFLGEIAGALGFEMPDQKKLGLSLATGVVKIALTGHGSFEMGGGNRALGGKLTVKKTGGSVFDGSGFLDNWELESEGDLWFEKHGVSTGERDTVTTSETDSSWLDGTSSQRETTTKTNPDGSKTETVTEKTYDQQGRESSSKTTTTEYDDKGNAGKPNTVDNPLPTDMTGDALDQGEDELL